MQTTTIQFGKKRFVDYLPKWLKDKGSLFYYFLFLEFLGILFFATSLFFNYFTTPFTGDYTSQQFAFYTNGYDDWWHFFKTGEFVLYDQNTFLGVNNIGSNSFYYLFDPFFLPILIVPRQLVPQGMALLTIVKIALAGLSFFFYIRYMGVSRKTAKIVGIAYAFSGWMAWYLWFNHFTDVTIVFPWILLGIEKTLREKKPWILGAALCVMGFVNFFFLICFALCGFLYAMFRYFQTIKTRSAKDNGLALLYGFLAFFFGILMPMMVVLPAGMYSINAPRAANSTYLSALKDAFKASNFKKIFDLLTSWTAQDKGDRDKARVLYPFIDFIFPAATCRGTPLTVLGNETYDNVAGSLFCYLPFMGLLVPSFIESLEKKHFSVLVPLVFFVVALFTPFFYYAFHGFTVAYSRWTLFVTTSLLTYTAMYLDKIHEKPLRRLLYGYGSLLIFVIVGGICANYIVKTYNQNFIERVPIWLAISLESVYVVVLAAVLILVRKYKKGSFEGTFTGFIIFELILMGAFVIAGHGVEDYYYDTNKGVVKNDTLHALIQKTWKNDKSYYRSFTSLASSDASNDSMRNGYNGTSMFHSLYNFNVADLCNWSSISGGTSPGSWSGEYVQKRVNFDTLMGIKYYYLEDDYFLYQSRRQASSETFRYNVPFNYADVTDEYKTNTFRVYKNMDYIDFALTYDNVTRVKGNPAKEGDNYDFYSDIGGKNPLKIEELYMRTALINESRDEKVIPMITEDYPDITMNDGLSYEDGRLNNYYTSMTLRTYGSHLIKPDSNIITFYDIKSHDANKSSLSLSAKEYIEVLNRDNDTYTKYANPLEAPAVDGGSDYRRWVAVIDTDAECFPDYDPQGNIYYINASFEWNYWVDIYFVDTNNQIVTYDNHNDGFYNSGRSGQQWRAFYITPEYGLNEHGELIMKAPAPKIKKIIFAYRGSKVPTMYTPYIDTYTKHQAKMDKLKEYVVENVKSSANTYKFDTNFDKNRLVVTRLAYEDGFSLKMKTADGKTEKVKVFNAQGGFVSFVSGTGACHYTLTYYTPYLQLGALISAFSVFTYVGTLYAYVYLDMRKRNREELFMFAK